MEHLAIMRRSWRLIQKILSGEKKIESRWYMCKYSPWDKIKSGEIIYFKDSGDLVRIKAEVKKVIQVSNLNSKKVKEILEKYGGKGGICIENIPKFFKILKNKKYCILIFLKNTKKIKPFKINKKGYGLMSAWITTENINNLRK